MWGNEKQKQTKHRLNYLIQKRSIQLHGSTNTFPLRCIAGKVCLHFFFFCQLCKINRPKGLPTFSIYDPCPRVQIFTLFLYFEICYNLVWSRIMEIWKYDKAIYSEPGRGEGGVWLVQIDLCINGCLLTEYPWRHVIKTLSHAGHSIT